MSVEEVSEGPAQEHDESQQESQARSPPVCLKRTYEETWVLHYTFTYLSCHEQEEDYGQDAVASFRESVTVFCHDSRPHVSVTDKMTQSRQKKTMLQNRGILQISKSQREFTGQNQLKHAWKRSFQTRCTLFKYKSK